MAQNSSQAPTQDSEQKEEPMKQTRKVPKQVRRFLEEKGLEFTVRGDRIIFTVDDVICHCVQIQKVVIFQANRVAAIDADKKRDVAELLNDIQCRYLMGTWSIDDDGDVNFAVSIFKEKGGPSDAAIERCLKVLVQCMLEVKPQLKPFVGDSTGPREPNETFLYPCGVQVAISRWFDISDEACEPFGFKHGDRVKDPETKQCATVIGVRLAYEGKKMLWFHVDGSPGAGVYEEEVLSRLKKIGSQIVEPAQ